MVMYGNVLKQKKIKFKPMIKLNHNTYINVKFAINLLYSYKKNLAKKSDANS